MSHAKQASNRKRKRKAVPVLGAAGLSLSLASGTSAIAGSAPDMLTSSPRVGHEITLRDEEISDVSLATFHVFDRENIGRTAQLRVRLAMAGGCGCAGCAGCGCWTGTSYTTSVLGSEANPPYHSTRPVHRHISARKRTHARKNP